MKETVSVEESKYVRLVGTERREGCTLKDVSRTWQGEKECFAFFSPHDDDVILGAGIFMQLALKEAVPVHVIIVTDGSMGYCDESEQDTICAIRKVETYNCYRSIGIPEENVHWLGFPDCNLTSFQGRRKCNNEEKCCFSGHTGLQNAFTHLLRKIRPTQCFVPTRNDLHPDNKITYDELLISLCQASGSIWPEFGLPLEKTPYIHEMAIYSDFPEHPTLRISSSNKLFENKIDAIGKFESQEQIDSLIDCVRNAGPCEYFRAINFQLYEPRRYHDMFEKRRSIPIVK